MENHLPTPEPSQNSSEFGDTGDVGASTASSHKRPAEDGLTGAPKRTGAIGHRGRFQHTNLNFSRPVVRSPNTTETVTEAPRFQPRQIPYSGATQRNKALNELIDNAPVHQKDITKNDLKKNFAKCSNRLVPVYPHGELKWNLQGMKTPINTYQALAVGWMRGREKSGEEPAGGILGDEMGLGKTLQMLAVILDGHLADRGRGGPTLIVSSPAIQKHVWKAQIKEHFLHKKFGDILIYQGMKAYNLLIENKFITRKQIIDKLKSATVVLATYGVVRRSWLTHKPPRGSSTDKPANKSQKSKGDVLHEVEFRRVVLDECTAIKNHKTQTAEACSALLYEHGWGLSGTPLEDKVEELFSYFELIGVPGLTDVRAFHQKYFTTCKLEGDTKKSYKPKKELTDLVRSVMIRRTAQTTIAGVPILVLPKLTYRDIEVACYPQEKIMQDNLKEVVKKDISEILRKLKHRKITEEDAKAAILSYITRRRLLASHFLLSPEEVKALLVRPSQVRSFVQEASKTECTDRASNPMIAAMTYSLMEYEEQRTKPKDGKRGKKIRFSMKNWLEKAEHGILLSSKTRAVEEQLIKWMKDAPERKIIVFSSFIAQLEIVEQVCKAHGWGVKMYHGQMTQLARSKVLKEWRKDPKNNILLSSLLAGGKGLNLVEASRAIIVDLHWNNAVEAQAIARIHRLGQTKECEVVRILVNDTYDDNLKGMQFRKSGEINEVLDGSQWIRRKQTTLAEMLRLTGVYNNESEIPYINDDRINFDRVSSESDDTSDDLFVVDDDNDDDVEDAFVEENDDGVDGEEERNARGRSSAKSSGGSSRAKNDETDSDSGWSDESGNEDEQDEDDYDKVSEDDKAADYEELLDNLPEQLDGLPEGVKIKTEEERDELMRDAGSLAEADNVAQKDGAGQQATAKTIEVVDLTGDD